MKKTLVFISLRTIGAGVALAASCVLMIVGHPEQALTTAVLFVGLQAVK